MIIYDCEIKKAILKEGEERIDGIEYCDGWRDFDNMGISVIGAYDLDDERYRVFMDDNIGDFQKLIDSHDYVCGFNNTAFDDQLCRANGIDIPEDRSKDILVSIWRAAGLGDTFEYPSHMGYGLDACCEANGFGGKSGHGALAPIQWQRGQIGSVIDYCLNDVLLTLNLLTAIQYRGCINNPKDPGTRIEGIRC